ncbi:MAG: cyclic nucleotide-binding domain-containing protein [Desulfobacterales bacterium]
MHTTEDTPQSLSSTSDSASLPELIDRPSDIATIQAVLPFAEPFFCRTNENVLSHGSASRCFYYVERGTVEVSYSEQGAKILVSLIGAGNFFGEIGFFDGTSRVRDIRAPEEAVILRFDPQTLARIEKERPSLYGHFLTVIIRKVCTKFRGVLEEQAPLTAYGASLSAGRRSFSMPKALPEQFFQTDEWRTVNRIIEEFKSQFYHLSYNLQQDGSPELSRELKDQGHQVLGRFNEHLQGFQDLPSDAEPADLMWGYVFKEIFPYFMRSRFAERAYFKPRGYAGDYLLMEMIYRGHPNGDGKLGRLVDDWCLNTTAAKSVRGRRKLLSRELAALSWPFLTQSRPVRIMNLACGPSRELFDFLEASDASDLVEALCIDIDTDALAYTQNQVDSGNHRASIRLMNENIVKWALGRNRQAIETQDIIYSAGLTDYFDDRLFEALIRRCYNHLKPGGVMLIGNFAPNNPERMFMDHIMQWKLFYRDKDAIVARVAASPFGNNVEVLAESEGVNLFIKAVRTK